MKFIIFIFFALFCSTFAQSKDEIISDFLKALKKNDVVQYKNNFSFNDESKGKHEISADCSEMIVLSDTAIGAYYHFSSDSGNSVQVYSGNEYYSYYPQYYGYGNVGLMTRKKNPERFQDCPIEFDGMKGYAPSIVTASSFYGTSIAYLRKYLTDKENLVACKQLPDTIINNINCSRILTSNFELAFDKKNKMPVHFFMNVGVQQTEVYYSDFKFNNPKSKVLFSRKAFPKNFKFASNLKSIDNCLKAGKEAPDFEVTSITGKSVKLSSLKGKPVFLYVTEIGCPPCMQALPVINKFHKDYKDLVVLGIYPLDSKDALKKLAKEKDLIFDIYHKAADVRDKYGVRGYPTFFIIDKNGVIKYSNAGYGNKTEEVLRKEIDKVLTNN